VIERHGPTVLVLIVAALLTIGAFVRVVAFCVLLTLRWRGEGAITHSPMMTHQPQNFTPVTGAVQALRVRAWPWRAAEWHGVRSDSLLRSGFLFMATAVVNSGLGWARRLVFERLSAARVVGLAAALIAPSSIVALRAGQVSAASACHSGAGVAY
jgi:hypothetical protein